MSIALQKNKEYIKIEENKAQDSARPKIKSKRNEVKKVFNQEEINPLEDKYNAYDSKMLTEPVINSSNFQRALDSQIKSSNKEKMKLKLLQYSILKESITQCSSFPSKQRKYIWQYLLSLPNNISLYQSYLSRGIHPFYKFINEMYPLPSETQSKDLQTVCSLLAHWSTQVGNMRLILSLKH